jgi:hypothetical protein
LEKNGERAGPNVLLAQGVPLPAAQVLRVSTLELHLLRAEVARSREQLSGALEELVARLAKMIGNSSVPASNGRARVAVGTPCGAKAA